MHHKKYNEAKRLIEAGIPVLLTGDAGSGKSTLAREIARDMDLRFFSISLTRQTTLSHMLGFLSVNGTYIPSNLRDSFENGGLMLLDELDAGDANVLLCLNTIENGYISFPDKLVESHPDFRLVATSNPQDQHQFYTGRSKLDGATLDRFDIIDVDRDDNLEKSLVDHDTHQRMQLMRKLMKEYNMSKRVSMRDAIRYQKRKDLNLLSKEFIFRLADSSDGVIEKYSAQVASLPKHQDQSECETFDDLWNLINIRAGGKPTKDKEKSDD